MVVCLNLLILNLVKKRGNLKGNMTTKDIEGDVWELEHPAWVMSGISTLRGEMRANVLYCLHGPFATRGAQGKKSTPSIGWEVPVRSH